MNNTDSNFADRLIKAIDEKQNPSAAGLDPAIEKLPAALLEKYRLTAGSNPCQAAAEAVYEFNRGIIDSIAPIVPAVKLQAAYYEELGPAGMEAFRLTAEYAAVNSLLVIGDIKRNDIGYTSRAYSNAYLGKSRIFGEQRQLYKIDAVTVNAYPGYEGIEPFIEDCREYGKGLFILVKTSNKGSEEFQSLSTEKGRNYEVMGRLTEEWGNSLKGEKGYSSIGAVVGATFPEEAKILRQIMKSAVFLVPGYGAQGGSAETALNCFNKDGCGALINSSRDIIFAFASKDAHNDYRKAAEAAALDMKKAITQTLRAGGICRW